MTFECRFVWRETFWLTRKYAIKPLKSTVLFLLYTLPWFGSSTKGCVQIQSVVGLDGIGGELGVPCTTNRLYGGPNAFGRRKRPLGFYTRTLMSRPHMTRVPRTVPGGEQGWDNRGNRSGRERSSPTWGHECCGVTGWRKCVGLAEGNERPP